MNRLLGLMKRELGEDDFNDVSSDELKTILHALDGLYRKARDPGVKKELEKTIRQASLALAKIAHE